MTSHPSSILVVAATNRSNALSKVVADYYSTLLQKEGASVELLSLEKLPPTFIETALYYNQGKDSDFNALAAKIDESRNIVFIVPQYNGSFPGILKTFIDGLSVKKLFSGKKGALIGLSKGYQGNILGLSHLTDILTYLGMILSPKKLYIANVPEPSMEALETHPDALSRLQKHAQEVVHFF